MNVGVITFPGSNCDADARYAATLMLQNNGLDGVVYQLWHKDAELPDAIDLIIIPGGFSYGDYLRTGAIARFSPIMEAVAGFAASGGHVLGICNGFQILCEAGLLPGALVRNANLRFVCKDVFLETTSHKSIFIRGIPQNQSPLRIPVAHGEGRFIASDEELDTMEANGQIAFRYVTQTGEPTPDANPNGSMRNIAGITNEQGNVLGMMPHPERAADPKLGYFDGLLIFNSFASLLPSNTLLTKSQEQYAE
ncbi:MAG: phosphoribosylformylglycinamidine synthase subunit PurQ [Chlorobi bacterium]|nr:MAG: phosphoribosylformylglycinamidine synthase subunit PurQ [Bacteroidota bacterium]KXK34397.1 MAG: phosphoribosylformylglycinamidine synthase [Chlorobi bacterium OLB6]MBE2265320.1 phosphoribosylformylglycinamidine synthase subunit PurQ [Flavobacteriales bacterium]MBL1160217.1 phosphoribosylformylglycinamidine synthase subunit PurQ [Chlorobiota bacterium]MBW7853355.1 phosphoribosylformylglycinamidine synthase subunit PurQ [Candidatus Kapabacteria bacterium]MCC6330402.1 phosphoribosylformyl